ncbi:MULTISPECIES: NUMOD4 domain-containing protein [Agrobacterium tumefaciens complex]|uniref:Putative Phage-related protein n=1 Tax=Agrobacterium tomkonis CFBP 6623 TaxID=1183432 RepID=A0A1S7PE99_9HYPH|nr:MULTISPECIES: NUMOD4 domain-containing protein [Agrobacterium tumefaciens complex]QCL88750.1 helix-turn-helix domain-containing protein [Agrobacterium tumefaciens]CUX20118.1 putative Phage-related protein [Agrobacterium tomkonis CFBP 6623]
MSRRTIAPEAWKPIPGFEDSYEASTHGRIRSLDRIVTFAASERQPAHTKRLRGKILRRSFTKGYPSVSLYRGSVRTQKMVHAIIADTFLGPRPPGALACHGNGIRTECDVDNIYWGTPQDNADDRRRHGNNRPGSQHANSKLHERDISKIRRLASSVTQKSLAERFGVSQSTISSIINNASWRHVPTSGVTA